MVLENQPDVDNRAAVTIDSDRSSSQRHFLQVSDFVTHPGLQYAGPYISEAILVTSSLRWPNFIL